MDDIDITSSEFTIHDTPSDLVGGGFDLDDYSLYIYIGIAILGLLSILLVYKLYGDRTRRVTFQDKLDDCYGDVCDRNS
jgi:hypothetical protein